MRWPLMMKRRWERERRDLIERHGRAVAQQADVFSVGYEHLRETMTIRNSVLEVTAENCRQWDALLRGMKCPSCGSPHGEFRIRIPKDRRVDQVELRRHCLACKQRTWRVRAALNFKPVGAKKK